ncbi:MAG: 3-hydroxyacyl-CoA dehydrogenase NAD-binding domain-containing protein [Promethearchaeota archaeon]|jgi:enoyl-CoA hydratase/3-hydroxyacyl-CoA dehydrogenase
MDVKNIVVIGVGLMGNGIAQVSLMAGYNVTLVDISQEVIDKAVENIKSGLAKLESKGVLNAAENLARMKTNLDLASAVKDADLIIEAVVEDMEVKKKLFKVCDENAPAHAVIASNTSTMSITEMATATNRPDKCIGMHFFNPAPLMRLIEVIAGEKSSDEAMEVGMKVSASLPCLRGDRYVAKVLKDRPGFIVNRLNAPSGIYMNYLLDTCLEKGIPFESLDADFGSRGPMSPLVLSDYTGIDTGFHVRNYYAETLHEDFRPGKVITKMFNEGKLGRKTGQGFYDWTKGRPQPDFSKIKKAGLVNPGVFLAIRLNEGCRILEEGIASGWKVIDDANMAGMNAPGPFEFGINNWQDLVNTLETTAEKLGKEYLKPCELFKSGKFVDMK